MTEPIEVYTRQSVDALLEPINLTIAEQGSAIAALQTQGQSLQAQSVVVSTASLPDQGSTNLAVELGKTFLLLRVEISTRCRLRLYRSAAYRASDASRLFGSQPTGEHGLLLDLIPTAGNLQWDLAPVVLGSNADSPKTSIIYAAVQNLSGSQQAINLNFSIIKVEA